MIAEMRVALLDPPSYTPCYDHDLAAALASRGHSVDLLTSRFRFGDVPAESGYRRHELFLPLSGRLLRRAPRSRARFLVKGLEYVPSVRRLLRRVRALDPDVVHVQWLAAPRYDLRWVRTLQLERTTVITVHDALRREGEPPPVWKELFGVVDGIVVHSQRAVERLAALGVGRDKVAHIRMGVSEAPDGDAVSPPKGKTLLFFGLIRAYKGLDLLVRALEPLSRQVPEARLVIAGDPVDAIEPVRELAASLGVADRVEWRLGFISQDEVDALMRTASVVVLPYRRGDASGVLSTAIAHGRPAVVSDLGAMGETVREFGAGASVPPDDVPALADACARLLGDEGALKAAFHGTRAAARALTWSASAEAHDRLYRALTAQKAEGAARVAAR